MLQVDHTACHTLRLAIPTSGMAMARALNRFGNGITSVPAGKGFQTLLGPGWASNWPSQHSLAAQHRIKLD